MGDPQITSEVRYLVIASKMPHTRGMRLDYREHDKLISRAYRSFVAQSYDIILTTV